MFLTLGNLCFKDCLFLVVLRKQTVKMLVGYAPGGVALIQLFNQPVKLSISLFCLCKTLPVLLNAFFLPQSPCFLYSLNKVRFIVLHIPAHALNCGEYRGFDFLCGNVVHRTVTGKMTIA